MADEKQKRRRRASSSGSHENAAQTENRDAVSAESRRNAARTEKRPAGRSVPSREARERDRLRQERRQKAAQRRKRQLIIRIVLFFAAVIAVLIGISRYSAWRKQKALEVENGTGTTILQAAEENVAGNQSGSGVESGASDSNAETSGSSETGSLEEMSLEKSDSGTAVTDPENSVTLCMVGDVILHQCMLDTYEAEDGSYDFSDLFANTASETAKYDIRIVNQETIMGGPEIGYSGYPAFNTPYEEADAIAGAGFNVVLQATNHTLDKGQEAVRNDLHYWNTSYPDIAVLGIHDESEPSQDIYVYEKNNIRVAILNYTYGTNQYYEEAAEGAFDETVNFLDPDRVQADIQAARERADYIVVCPHWGEENQSEISEQQSLWTQNFLDWGVDLVIGTHPHVIQPVQVYTGDDGHQMLVYNSLGNFCSNQEDRYGNVGAMAQVVIERGEDGTVHTGAYGVYTLVTHETGDEEAFTTYFLDTYSEELAAENGVLATDPDFSWTYCWNLRDEIFGDLGKLNI